MDDEASKASQASKDPSGSEEDNRSEYDAASDNSVIIHSSYSQRSKVRTAKGSYVAELLLSGNVNDVVEPDSISNNPTLALQSAQREQSPSVYLEDLESMAPMPRSKGRSTVKGGSSAACRKTGKGKKVDLSDNTHLDIDMSVDAATSTLVKTMGLSSAKPRGEPVPDRHIDVADLHADTAPVAPVDMLSHPAVVHTCNFAKYGVKPKYQYAWSTGGHSPLNGACRTPPVYGTLGAVTAWRTTIRTN
ncbi:hypothetical protein EDD18DRAFT_1364598 [Armillaria luteobubalina]|uniref:Uncharacterized protein n=1 Tax=Armillaria luteobubalina TaxID=153913 RepID=A0AA39P7Q7_9AGAR|nr:hypothetical protein EDD18DRAFT_1364598 [Armillaria luteobubalina]